MKRMILIIGMLLTLKSTGFPWVPPIGIPAPEFGINEQAPSQPAEWPVAANTNSYYIDNTHPQATDTANTYGYPNKPRMTIPMILTLSAGTLVEIHGGPYLATTSAYAWQIRSSATTPPTAEAPAFIRGFDGVVWGASQEAVNAKTPVRIECGGTQGQGMAYTIIEGIHFRHNPIAILGYTSHHTCIRNCEGSDTAGTVMSVNPSEPWVSGTVFTADASDVCVGTAHGFVTGAPIRVSTTGTLPNGLAAYTTYYAMRLDNNSLRIALTAQNAADGIAIDITDAGTGTHRLVKYVASEIHNIVFYNNLLHDTYMWDDVSKDWDYHGMVIATFGRTSTTRLRHVWVLDSTMYHCSGDAVQINGHNAGNDAVHHIYVGRNTAYQNRQCGFGCKQATDVIMSQNTIHTMTAQGGGLTAPGMNVAYGPNRLWYIFNEIYNCSYGIRQSQDAGLPTGNTYFIGNYIHDLRQDTDVGHWNSPPGWGFSFWSGGNNRHIVNNTMVNVYGGIETIQAGPVYAKNNIIYNLKPSNYPALFGAYRNHIECSNSGGNGVNVDYINTLMYGQVGGVSQQARVKWMGGQYTTLAAAQMAIGKLAGSIEADPLMDGVKLRANSPAIDAGVESDVYQTFQDLYGIDIRRSFDGGVRPLGSRWDIGACEYDPAARKPMGGPKLRYHGKPQ